MIENLIRPHIKRLVPYSTARDEFKGTARVYLDANENPFPSDVNRYPDPQQRAIKGRISELWGISESRLFIGNGSDEPIDLIVRAVAAPGDTVVIQPPTYGMYRVAAMANDVRIAEVPLLENFEPDLRGLSEVAEAKILFVCSPNNPTGNQLPLDVVWELTKRFDGVIVVDEAYIDFAPGKSAATLIDQCDRVVVLRTLSKAFGLAGARLGIAIADERMTAALAKIKAPYNVNSLTQYRVLSALEDTTRVKRETTIIVSERERMTVSLKALPITKQVFPSDANFILAAFYRARELFDYLRENGVIVRDRSSEHQCEGCLRITIGSPEENDILLELMRGFQ